MDNIEKMDLAIVDAILNCVHQPFCSVPFGHISNSSVIYRSAESWEYCRISYGHVADPILTK